jgi:hypothetical protein
VKQRIIHPVKATRAIDAYLQGYRDGVQARLDEQPVQALLARLLELAERDPTQLQAALEQLLGQATDQPTDAEQA